MKCYEVNSFEGYINLVHELRKEKRLWYRGQSNASHRLIPGVLRYAVTTEDWAGRKIKAEKTNFSNGKGEKVEYPNYWSMLSEFKDSIKGFYDGSHRNDISWLCLGQHYGLLTPLLDWSTDPLVALFFATDGVDVDKYEKEQLDKLNAINEYDFEYISDDIEFKDDCAAVYIIDPVKINEGVGIKDWESRVLDIEKDNSIIESMIENGFVFPCCLHGEKNDRRMCRQSGNFTFHGYMAQPIDYMTGFRKDIIKILIPYSLIRRIRSILVTLDLTSESIYFGEDEKDKKAKEVTKANMKKFKEKFKEVF